MPYTYEDFYKAATDSGMLDQFSQDDLAIAQQHPEFGMSILGLKQDYANAPTEEARWLANYNANELRRSYGGYSGGPAGSDYVVQPLIQQNINSGLNRLGNYGSFNYGAEDAYKAALDRVANRQPWSYDPATDPVYQAYADMYRREGERALKDTYGQLAARTGGLGSSYAAQAAAGANNYYLQQLNDVVPTLYQQAYERYANDYNMDQAALQAMLADRQMRYGEYGDQYNMLNNYLQALQGQDATNYARQLDAYNMQMQSQASARDEVNALIAAGIEPGADLLRRAGYTDAYSAVAQFYADQDAQTRAAWAAQYGDTSWLKNLGVDTSWIDAMNAAQLAKSSGTGTRTGGPGTEPDEEPMTITDAINAFNSGDYSDEVIQALLEGGYTMKQIETAMGGTGAGSEKNNIERIPQTTDTGTGAGLSYDSAKERMKQAGVAQSVINGLASKAAWEAHKKSSREDDPAVRNYDTYEDYLRAYVQYALGG